MSHPESHFRIHPFIHSSRTLPLADGARTWCRNGDAGREVDRPIDLTASNGSGTLNLSSVYLGVFIDSIVVFSKLAMRSGGGLLRFRSGPLYRKVDARTSTVPARN